MIALLQDPQIKQIINPPNTVPHWEEDLQRLQQGDLSLNRRSAGENSIQAFQRLLIFLGYSTSSTGAFAIDGDFGRGTNRGLAQFEFDHGISSPGITKSVLTYECTWQTAKRRITIIPDVKLTIATLTKMLEVAKEAIANNEVSCGDFDEAIFQLNALHNRQLLNCRQINERYGSAVEQACATIQAEDNRTILPEWILAIIRQESAGVVRPRFEQHWLTKLSKQNPNTPLSELRYQSMSFGLGQIMGFNANNIGASSAKELYTFPMEKQIASIARFLMRRSSVRAVVSKSNPTVTDFQTVARFYNGSGFAAHHYDESLARWFREFKVIRG